MVTFRAALVHFVYQFRPATRRNHKRRKGRIERKKNANWTKGIRELNRRKTRIEQKGNDERSFHVQRAFVSSTTNARFHRNEGSIKSLTPNPSPKGEGSRMNAALKW